MAMAGAAPGRASRSGTLPDPLSRPRASLEFGRDGHPAYTATRAAHGDQHLLLLLLVEVGAQEACHIVLDRRQRTFRIDIAKFAKSTSVEGMNGGTFER